MQPMPGIDAARRATVRVCNRDGAHRGQGLLLDLGEDDIAVLTCHHVVASLDETKLSVAVRQEDGQCGKPIPAQYDTERSRPSLDAVVLRIARAQVPALARPVLHGLEPKTYPGSLHAIGFTHLQPDNFSARVEPPTRLEVPAEIPGPWLDAPARYVIPLAYRLAYPSDARRGISGGVVFCHGGVLGLAHFARDAAPDAEREVYLVPLSTWADGWSALSGLIKPLAARDLLRDSFAPVLDDRSRLFAGREAALERLADFVADPRGGYLMVTAPAGFGKTALVANFVRGGAEAFAYHFFTPLYQASSLSEGFFLRNVVEQLAPWHGHTNPLPDEGDVNALRALYQKFLGEPVDGTRVLVLDGLDEVSWDLAPYLSRSLPSGLHVILTVRDVGQDWAQEYHLPAGEYQHFPLGGLVRDGVAAVLRQAGDKAVPFADDPQLLDEVMRVAAYAASPALGADPFYVRFLAEDAAAGDLTPDHIADEPAGLEPYLDRWWNEIKREQGEAAVRALFSTLVVALGPIERSDLERINPSLVDEWAGDKFDDVLARVRRLVMRDASGRYTVAHPRLRQYLETRIAAPALEKAREKLMDDCFRWQQHRSPYALRYYPQHLATAVDASEPAQCPTAIQRLVGLVVDGGFQAAHQEVVNDPAALQQNIEQALGYAAGDSGVQPSLVIEAALALVSFRQESLVPEQVFALAREGKIADAERRLSLFALQLDTNWYRALQLAIAWLAFEHEPVREQARALHQRVEAEAAPNPALDLLRAHIAATIDAAPLPYLAPLGDVPHPMLADAIVARLAGRGIDASLMGELLYRQGPRELLLERDYLAAKDGPQLVALAVADLPAGNERLQKYLDVHRAYGYVQYRNRSLWVLLGAILRHPDQRWVQEWLCQMGAVAMAPSIEFQEGLGLTALALQAVTDPQHTRQDLQDLAKSVQDSASELSQERGHADSWGAHKRRLAALAEALSRSLELGIDPALLLDKALEVPYGFAGYEAPACLMLAEAIQLVRPGDRQAIDRGLEKALVASRNVQDPTFCARTTARVNAMQAGWWSPAGVAVDVAQVVAHLCQHPEAKTFAARHLVGDEYTGRAPAGMLPLDDLICARTLRALARAYDRPLPDFVRLNASRGWDADQPLDSGESVHVPDPEFGPLLAPRLAALALLDARLSPGERVEVIRSLVPVASANPTTLDTVLSRFLLAWQPNDLGTLQTLRQTVARHVGPPVADVELPALPS